MQEGGTSFEYPIQPQWDYGTWYFSEGNVLCLSYDYVCKSGAHEFCIRIENDSGWSKEYRETATETEKHAEYTLTIESEGEYYIYIEDLENEEELYYKQDIEMTNISGYIEDKYIITEEIGEDGEPTELFSGEGSYYTFKIFNNGIGTQEVSIKDNVCTDKVGNENKKATSNTITFDVEAPTINAGYNYEDKKEHTAIITIEDTLSGLAEGTYTVKYVWSEEWLNNINWTNVSTAIQISAKDGEKKATGTVTKSDGTGTYYLYVQGVNLKDRAGNVSNDTARGRYDFDNTAPTCEITVDTTDISRIKYTFTFSESVIGFTKEDIAVIGGNKVGFSGSLDKYTLIVDGTGETEQTVSIDENVCTDDAGNGNISATKTITLDITPPTCTITANKTSPTNVSSITYTFTFSENVIGFTAEDVTVTNGTKGTFSGSGTTYILVVTNTGTCTQSVSVAANKCTDSAGNNNTASNTMTITVDRTGPTVTITQGTVTSKSIQVSVRSSDSGSGMPTSPSYKYYLNGTLKSTTTAESYTFSGLDQNTSYTIKVTTNDKLGNTGTGSESISTNKITGTVTFGITWSGETANVKINTESEYQIQWKKFTEEWSDAEGRIINNGDTVTGLKDGETISARLWDGRQSGGTTGSINIQHPIKEINISDMILDGGSLITVTLADDTIATSSDVTWSTSNSNVATVTKNGIVMCSNNTGTAKVTCSKNGATRTCDVISYANKVYTNNTSANRTATNSTSGFTYNQPIIPVGFTAINTIDAKWKTSGTQTDYNKGLVIMDDKGNQFVWVPIDGSNVTYTKWCTTTISYSSCSDDTLPATDKATTYGGFWIGRYEAGIDVDMGTSYQTSYSTRNVTGIPIIVEGAIPWNYIDYTNSQTNANNMYKTSYVQSGLVNGTQWDTTMKWLQNVGGENVSSDSTSWGNYYSSSLTLDRYKVISKNYGISWLTANATSKSSIDFLRTGSSTTTKALNVSDLAGNLDEWTNEIYNGRGVSRGSQLMTTYPADERRTYSSDEFTYGHVGGLRVSLYVK